jgi:hypothetical protein
MKLAIALLLLFGASSAGASPEAQVLVMDQDLPIEELNAPGEIKVHTVGKRAASELLPPHVQERFVRDAGLETATQGWDAFERDRLFLRVENQEAKVVSDRYQGRIGVAAVRNLQRMIRRYRADQRGTR